MIPKAVWDHWVTLLTNLGLHVLYALVIFFVGTWMAKRFSRFNLRLLKKRDVDTTVAQFLNRMLHYVIMLLLIIMAVLAQLGVQTASLLAIMGGMSLALGLALRSSISNVASGMLLIIFRPFKVGDAIEINSHTGTVMDIQMLFTKIRTAQYQEITIPNDQFMKNAVMNYSSNDIRRADIVIGIGYDDDISNRVRQSLNRFYPLIIVFYPSPRRSLLLKSWLTVRLICWLAFLLIKGIIGLRYLILMRTLNSKWTTLVFLYRIRSKMCICIQLMAMCHRSDRICYC